VKFEKNPLVKKETNKPSQLMLHTCKDSAFSKRSTRNSY